MAGFELGDANVSAGEGVHEIAVLAERDASHQPMVTKVARPGPLALTLPDWLREGTVRAYGRWPGRSGISGLRLEFGAMGRDLTVRLAADRPGELAGVVQALSRSGVNIEGIAEIDGVVHVLARDPSAARASLRAARSC